MKTDYKKGSAALCKNKLVLVGQIMSALTSALVLLGAVWPLRSNVMPTERIEWMVANFKIRFYLSNIYKDSNTYSSEGSISCFIVM